MKKLTTLLLCSLFWLSTTITFAGSNIMKIHDVTAIPGDNITVSIEVINEDVFVAFQVDIPLPTGFGYVAGSFALTARSNGHLANGNILPGTTIFRGLAFSLTNAPFNGNSGVVATFSLTTPTMAGTYVLVPTNAIISNPQGAQILTGTVNGTITLTTGTTLIPGDANCDGNVNAIDIITLVNYIMGFNPQPFCFENADVNGDGSVNAIDVIGTVNIILGGSGFTCGTSTITDVDGNVYNTVLINNQCWMKENLKTTKYRNNTPIEYPGSNNSAWQNNTTGAYAWYNNDISWKDSYGALYNWHTVNNANGLCPTGWHVPTDAEFTAMTNHLGGTSIAGGKMKSTRTVPDPHPRWESPNTGATNESNWSGLPGGFRNTNGAFINFGYSVYWWSSTEGDTSSAWTRYLNCYDGNVARLINAKALGFSARCVRDEVRTEVD